MSSDIAIRVEGLGKAYTVRHRRHDHVTLAQTALERLKHPFHRDEREEFWALRDVSFEVKRGEVLGIIGRNGAGKSTLLKLLTRITAPTTGRVDLWGRVGSLLEVGTGFHPELTGRENVYLNGSILGMTRKEIDRQFDEIVAFAGVEKFLDTPVKRYSSGMYVRLAFAVAAHLQTEILLVDEVLAVGDAEFQRRCLAKLSDLSMDGRTVLLVSHQLSSVVALCSMALLLESGSLSLSAAPEEAVVRYSSQLALLAEVVPIDQRSRFLRSVTTDPLPSKPGALREFQIAVGVVEGLRVNYWISVHIVNSTGDVVAQCDSRLSGMLLDPTVEQMIGLTLRSPWLLPGSYHLDVFLCCIGVVEHTDWVCQFTVAHDSPHVGALIDEATAASPVLADFKYEAKGRLP